MTFVRTKHKGLEMFNDFLTKLIETLRRLNVTDIDKYVSDYTTRFNALRDSNKSEFESVIALGDPVANAYAIAGVDYTAEEQLKTSLGLSDEALNVAKSDGDIVASESAEPTETIQFSVGEKVFYWVFVIIALALEIALYFVTIVAGIVSISYLIIAFMHYSGTTAWAVFGLSFIGLITFLIFSVIATVLLKKVFVFARKLIR